MSQPPSRSPSQQAADEERRASFLPPWLSRAVSLGAAGAISAIVVASIRDVGPTIGLSWEGAAWLANNFVTESGLRMLLGSVVTRSTASSTSDGAGLSWQETSTFQPVPTGRRAVLSVVVWVPLFSGAVLATVKCLFQLNSRDTVASVRRSSAARASATPPTSYTTARFPTEAKSSPLQDASPFGVESPPLAAAPPERRLDLMEESSSCNTTATATPRDSRSRHPSLPSIPQLGLPADDSSDTAAVDSRTASPTSASTRELDSVTLAIVSPCSLVDLNAFLTAGGKYYVRNVVVPHGNAKRNGAQPSDTAQGHDASENTLRSSQARLIGTTPRGETSPPLPQRFAHVTRRTLEFIGRFQRNVNLCEVSENIDVATFLRANAVELHGPRHGAPVVVTVAIHRHPVPNAVRLIDFTHPPSAAYCFAKSPSASLASSSSPVASRTSSFGSPTAARTVDSSFTGAASDEFGSPLTASAYARHVAAAGSRVSDAMEERRPEDEALDFCDLHVYLSGSTAHNTLASTVNMVLYDRAAKRRRMKYTEGDDNHDMATS